MQIRECVKEPPKRTKWDDKLIGWVAKKLHQGFSFAQIAKELECNRNTLKAQIVKTRKKPQWEGKIPYIKISQRPNIDTQIDKVGILDIEFFNFGGNRFHQINARLGVIFSYALKEYKKNNWYSEKIRFKDLRKRQVMDRNITEHLVRDISRFDVIVGFFSSGCDIPFVRTRAMHYGIPFPLANTIKQIDLFHFAKHKLLLDHNSLRSLSKLLNVKGKDNIEIDEWFYTALLGDRNALQKIYSHNIGDVKATEGDFEKIEPYLSMNSLRSI